MNGTITIRQGFLGVVLRGEMAVQDKPEISDEDPAPGSQPEAPYQGVHGLLLVYCIILIFIVPFVGAFSLINNYQRASSDFEYVPGLHVFLIMDTILRVFLVGFSMYAGASLWSLWPGAVRTVKIYLFSFLGTLFLALVLVFILVEWRPQDQDLLFREIFREVLPSLIYFTVSYCYVSFSKRIRATYPE